MINMSCWEIHLPEKEIQMRKQIIGAINIDHSCLHPLLCFSGCSTVCFYGCTIDYSSHFMLYCPVDQGSHSPIYSSLFQSQVYFPYCHLLYAIVTNRFNIGDDWHRLLTWYVLYWHISRYFMWVLGNEVRSYAKTLPGKYSLLKFH